MATSTFVASFLLSGLATLDAQVVELAKVSPADGAMFKQFGWSVSLSGDRLLVGAVRDGDLATAAGSAYVWERDATGEWIEVAKLTASDAAGNDHFGYAVSLAGDRAVVSAWQNDSPLADSGSAYVFEPDAGGVWVEVARLEAADKAAGDLLGSAVSLSGDRVLLGAFGDDAPLSGSGSAYVLERDAGGEWIEADKLVASDGAASDSFGWSASLSGDRALVGAFGDDAPLADAGSAYVFERDPGGAWHEVAKLTADDARVGDWFGYSVSLSGDRALVGARYGNSPTANTGAAYVFERDPGGAWIQVAKLAAPDLHPLDDFGFTAAISGDRAVVGAIGDDDIDEDSGAAHVFERQRSGAWIHVTKLLGSEGAAGDALGVSVSLSGDRVFVGANADDAPLTDSGSIYGFDLLPLSSPVTQISLSAGGAQTFEIDAGHLHAAEIYLVLGTISGTAPGIPLASGLLIPLNPDAYLNYTFLNPGTFPLTSSFGLLSSSGSATASFALPPGIDPTLSGIVVHHAFLAIDPVGKKVTLASNPMALALVP